MDAAIELRNVTKTFGQTTAVKDLNLTVPNGGLYGFIGPNGAGKTTTIRLILSIFLPDSGEISVLGHSSALRARSRIGYLPEERGVYRKMRVGAFLKYIAGLKGVKDLNIDKTIRASLERVGLGGTERRRCEELSKGMLQKVQLLAAVIHKPDLLILDEPTNGMDLSSKSAILDLIAHLHEEDRITIVMVSHLLDDVANTVRRIAIVDRDVLLVGTTGEVLTPENLSRIYRRDVRVGMLEGSTVILSGRRHGHR